jgi:hypothetical protein
LNFVSDGVRAAIEKAQAIAQDGTVAVTARTIARQCLELGLLDAVAVDLVPVVMGSGPPPSVSCRRRMPRWATRRSASKGIGSPTSCSP